MRKVSQKFVNIFFLTGLFLPANVLALNVGEQYNRLLNPLPDQELYCPTARCELVAMFLYFLKIILTVLPIVAILFLIIGGFQMVASSGNEERIVRAKRTVFWSIMGLVIAIMSFTIIAVTENFIRNVQ